MMEMKAGFLEKISGAGGFQSWQKLVAQIARDETAVSDTDLKSKRCELSGRILSTCPRVKTVCNELETRG